MPLHSLHCAISLLWFWLRYLTPAFTMIVVLCCLEMSLLHACILFNIKHSYNIFIFSRFAGLCCSKANFSEYDIHPSHWTVVGNFGSYLSSHLSQPVELNPCLHSYYASCYMQCAVQSSQWRGMEKEQYTADLLFSVDTSGYSIINIFKVKIGVNAWSSSILSSPRCRSCLG